MVARRTFVLVHRLRGEVWATAPDGGGARQVTYALVTSTAQHRAPGVVAPTAPRSRSPTAPILCKFSDLAGAIGRVTRDQQTTASVLGAFPDWQPAGSCAGAIFAAPPSPTTRSAATGTPAHASSSSRRTSRRTSSASRAAGGRFRQPPHAAGHRRHDHAGRTRDDRTGWLLRLHTLPATYDVYGHRLPGRRSAARHLRRHLGRSRQRRGARTAGQVAYGDQGVPQGPPGQWSRSGPARSSSSEVSTSRPSSRPAAAGGLAGGPEEVSTTYEVAYGGRDRRAAAPGDAEPAREPEGRHRRGLPEARRRRSPAARSTSSASARPAGTSSARQRG